MKRLLLLITTVALLALPAAAGGAPAPAAATTSVAAADGESSFRATKTISRINLAADGADQVVFNSDFTVTADKTTELRGRERLRITWSGARQSAGRASDPYGEAGLAQEYPVVILQCRGVDDADAPLRKRLRPETCWTSTSVQRSAVVPHRVAVWRHDRHASDAERLARSGVEPFPQEECEIPSDAVFSAKITPFVAADGTQYLGCDAEHMPPEAAADSAFPAAEIAAFSDEDGRGHVDFEVRSDVENESLGCSHKVDCSIVVIPIVGISCMDQDVECRRNGTFLPGSSNFEGSEPQAAVAPRFWWAQSNWQNRVTIPIKFGLPPDTCEVLDPRPPVGFYGSELLAQASLQWAPAYCLNKKRFKFQHNQMPDAAGYNLMSAGQAVAALVSGPQRKTTDTPIGFAPIAVSGFGVGYVVDKPDNAGEYGRLRLNARLLAKLLTQSYPASSLGREHPGLEENPLSINLDPEFIRLNPGLDTRDREAAATLLALSDSSDVIEGITGYIASDPDATAFIAGKPDPWGMKVNPSYKGINVPRDEWPLLDDFKPTAQPGTCRYENNDTPYLSQVAAPVTTLRKISDALIDSWPNVQTTCEGPLAGGLYKLGRVERQPYGQRFMMGIVSLGDAARFGLDTALLETRPGTFVGPSKQGLERGVAIARQQRQFGPFAIDQAAVRRDGRAYPGTMVVYTAARLQEMEKEDARLVASFVRIATTEGQVPGRSNGELPEGFLPIRKSGVTAELYASAQDVADAVEAQEPTEEPTEEPSEQPSSNDGGSNSGAPVTPPGVPGDGEPSGAASPSADPSVVPTAVDMPATAPVASARAKFLVPMLVLLGLVGCIVALVMRVAVPAVRGRR